MSPKVRSVKSACKCTKTRNTALRVVIQAQLWGGFAAAMAALCLSLCENEHHNHLEHFFSTVSNDTNTVATVRLGIAYMVEVDSFGRVIYGAFQRKGRNGSSSEYLIELTNKCVGTW